MAAELGRAQIKWGFLLYGVVECIYFCISCVRLSFLALFIGSRGNCRPAAEPWPICSNIANSNGKKQGLPSVAPTSYFLFLTRNQSIAQKWRWFINLWHEGKLKICDIAAGNLSYKQVWRVTHHRVLCVTVWVSMETNSSSHPGKIVAVTEEDREGMWRASYSVLFRG